MLSPGTEWIVDAHGCRPDALRSRAVLEALFAQVIEDLQLRPVSAPVWHTFAGEGGITGVVLLAESHLSCHTFPESAFAAFNLYCCRPREAWPWEAALAERLGATLVHVRREARGLAPAATLSRGRSAC
jgi:S-adenosylmethionine decarboxylase